MQHNHHSPHPEHHDDLQKGAGEAAVNVGRAVAEVGVQAYYAHISKPQRVSVEVTPARHEIERARNALLAGEAPDKVMEGVRKSEAVQGLNLNPERQEKFAGAIYRRAEIEQAMAMAIAKPVQSLSKTPRLSL